MTHTSITRIEIPTGLYLLRNYSKSFLNHKFPELDYNKFVLSALLRIASGYLFLINVIVVLVQADQVIVIFYDVLALQVSYPHSIDTFLFGLPDTSLTFPLQFIQKLDDIAFSVSKMDVLGKRLQRATMAKYFHMRCIREKDKLGLKHRTRLALKTLYFVNLAVSLSAMIVVSGRQISGHYQCNSITVMFGDEVWENSIVQWPLDSVEYPPGLQEKMVLTYASFNGVYVKDGSQIVNGRPIYVEMKKSDRTPFDVFAPANDPYDFHGGGHHLDPVKPAIIKYCNGRWILTHEYILKSLDGKVR